MKATGAILQNITSDRKQVDEHLDTVLPERPELNGFAPVYDAMRYAVLGSGQRLRPLIARRIARLAGSDHAKTLDAAAAVEMVHSASLIVDDLPCMDNEQERRGRPCVHAIYGEATAVLAAFGLVALAARMTAHLQPFQITLLRTLDVTELLGGQYMDLQRSSTQTHIADLKTVPLFDLAAHAGLIDAQLSPPECAELVRFAREFGLAYQMTDDVIDGDVAAPDTLVSHFDRVRSRLAPFGESADELHEIVDYLHGKAEDRSHR